MFNCILASPIFWLLKKENVLGGFHWSFLDPFIDVLKNNGYPSLPYYFSRGWILNFISIFCYLSTGTSLSVIYLLELLWVGLQQELWHWKRQTRKRANKRPRKIISLGSIFSRWNYTWLDGMKLKVMYALKQIRQTHPVIAMHNHELVLSLCLLEVHSGSVLLSLVDS